MSIILAGKAEKYFQLNAAIATLMTQQKELAKEIKALAKVSPQNKRREMLTPKYRLLVSWIKKCKVPEHYRAGHSMIKCSLRPEWVVSERKVAKRDMKSVYTF